METASHEDRKVYEIGYLLTSSVPQEKVSGETESLKKIVTDAGASFIAEGEPALRDLAYEIRKKTVSGTYDTFSQAYFGWMKFDLDPKDIEGVKKAFEIKASVLRILVITTVRENTYLGKDAPGIEPQEEKKAPGSPETEAPAAPAGASVEDMDKSIDAMVKEV